MRVAARGLPLVCVNPAVCFGAGDHLLTSTRLVRSFLLGRMPVYTEGAISVVDVRDVAEGHLLADRLGQPGERYILGGRNFTFDRLFADLGRLSGIDPPVQAAAGGGRAAAGLLASAGRGWPLTPLEVRAASQWWTYRSTQAPAGSSAGARARTRRRSRRRSRGTWSASRTGSRARAARSRSSSGWPGAAVGATETAVGLLRALRPRP